MSDSHDKRGARFGIWSKTLKAERKDSMREQTKNETIVDCLKAIGFQLSSVGVVPKVFQFEKGGVRVELEFARRYFDNASVEFLHTQMREAIIPALQQHPGSRIYVSKDGIRPVDISPKE